MVEPGGARLALRPAAAVAFLLLLAVRAEALQARVTEWQVAGGTVRAAIELGDVFAERFRRLVDEGRTIHVQVTCELWEARTVWDRLARPAVVSVFGVMRDRVGHTIVVEDADGARTAYPPFPRSILVWVDVAPAARFDVARTYYLHAWATVGAAAEREIEGVSDAVFGTGPETGGLGTLGKLFFQKVLTLADYLQSESCETTSRKVSGREIRGK